MAIWPRVQSTVSGWALRKNGRARGGIARVTDGHVADQVVEQFGIKYLRYQAHAMVLEKFPVVAGDNAGAFLSAMLEGVKTIVRQFRRIRMAENAEDTTIMFGVILLHRLLAPAAELSQTKLHGARRNGTKTGSCQQTNNELHDSALRCPRRVGAK